MTLIRTFFGRADGEISSVYFLRGDLSACQSAAHAMASRLAVLGLEYSIVRDSEGYRVKLYTAGPNDTSVIVRETRAALRDARALWRARRRAA